MLSKLLNVRVTQSELNGAIDYRAEKLIGENYNLKPDMLEGFLETALLPRESHADSVAAQTKGKRGIECRNWKEEESLSEAEDRAADSWPRPECEDEDLDDSRSRQSMD